MRVVAIIAVAAGCRFGFDPGAADGSAGDADAEPGLVARISCDVIDNGVLVDATGHGHDGTCTTCPTIVTPGRIGAGACRFTASGERVTLAPIAMSTYTIAAWLYVDTLPAMTQCPINRAYGPTIENAWQLCADNSELVFYTVGAMSPTISAPGGLAPHLWTHALIQWDGQTKALFVNGILAASVAADDLFDAHSILIGEDEDSGAPVAPYNGYLDDIRIYDRILSADELAALVQGS